ncbi:MAG: ParB N-terminal domain-containing protein, partial [Dehalococcoidia bacterium]
GSRQALAEGRYEVLSGNQRLQALQELGFASVPCMEVDLDDARARLLAQTLNRLQGADDLGLKAELLRRVLADLPQAEALAVLPDSVQGLADLASLGQGDLAAQLQVWQQAQGAKLKHLQFQLTPTQLPVVEEVLDRFLPQAQESLGDNPNARGTALFLLCQHLLQQEADE